MLDELVRRQWAATVTAAVSRATGMSQDTIRKGVADLAAREADPRAAIAPRLRSAGGGRKRITDKDVELVDALDRLVDPVTRGDPQSPWTCKSTYRLAEELAQQGHRNAKEGESHLDRNAQFEYINMTAKRFHQSGQPVISVPPGIRKI